MKDMLTAVARVMAMENGAGFAAMPGVAYDLTDGALATMAEALTQRLAPIGVDLLSLDREGDLLMARINEDLADEPICPMAFDRVVRQLSYSLLGAVWQGKLAYDSTPAPAQRELVRVA
jgi:hypothetical protein